MRKYAFFILMVVHLSAPAYAWNTADNLYHYCKAEVEEWSKGGQISQYASNCDSYFEGVGDALETLRGPWNDTKCMSDRFLNLEDLNNIKIFVEYMDKHKELQDPQGQMAFKIILKSLDESCKQ